MSLLRERRAFRWDYILVAVVILLTLVGLVTLYSASYLFALNQPWRFGSRGGWTPIYSNFVVVVIMLALFPILALVNLDLFKRRWVVFGLVMATIVLNLLPFVPFLRHSGFAPDANVMRWIIIRTGNGGFVSFQPSELIKFVLPLYLAYILDKNGDRLNKFPHGPLPPALVTGVFCLLMYLQNNFSEMVLIVLISLAVCFVAGMHRGWFGFAAVLAVATGYVLTFGNRDGRWFRRLDMFFNPAQDASGGMTQIDMSLEAIRAGGFLGRGIGQGTLKTRIPEVHGDFVFASFAEEFGLLGVFLHLVLLGAFAGISFYIVSRNRNMFSQLLGFGLVAPIVMQTLLNVAVVANAVPTTGVALPFVSSGGSSLLITLCASALLVNLARRHVLSLDEEDRYVG